MMVQQLDLDIVGLGVVETGIRKLVEVLWQYGYLTVCSCAGHLCDLEPLPWVTIMIGDSGSEHLFRLSLAVGRFNLKQGKNGNLPAPEDIFVLAPQMTQRGFAVYLRPQSLNSQREQKELDRLRRLGEDLASFIDEQCQDLFSSS